MPTTHGLPAAAERAQLAAQTCHCMATTAEHDSMAARTRLHRLAVPRLVRREADPAGRRLDAARVRRPRRHPQRGPGLQAPPRLRGQGGWCSARRDARACASQRARRGGMRGRGTARRSRRPSSLRPRPPARVRARRAHGRPGWPRPGRAPRAAGGGRRPCPPGPRAGRQISPPALPTKPAIPLARAIHPRHGPRPRRAQAPPVQVRRAPVLPPRGQERDGAAVDRREGSHGARPRSPPCRRTLMGQAPPVKHNAERASTQAPRTRQPPCRCERQAKVLREQAGIARREAVLEQARRLVPIVPVVRAPAGWRVAGRVRRTLSECRPASSTTAGGGGRIDGRRLAAPRRQRQRRPALPFGAPAWRSAAACTVQAGQSAHDRRLRAAALAAAAWSEGGRHQRGSAARLPVGRGPARGAMTAIETIKEGARRAGAS